MSELVECLQIAHLEGYEYEAQKAEAYVRDLEEDLVRLRLIVAKMLGEMENALSEFSDSAGADFFDPFYDVMVLARNILAELKGEKDDPAN